MSFKQAERTLVDGPMSVNRTGEGGSTLVVAVTHGGEERSIIMSEYNAARVLGTLAVMLGIDLPRTTAKAIKL